MLARNEVPLTRRHIRPRTTALGAPARVQAPRKNPLLLRLQKWSCIDLGGVSDSIARSLDPAAGFQFRRALASHAWAGMKGQRDARMGWGGA